MTVKLPAAVRSTGKEPYAYNQLLALLLVLFVSAAVAAALHMFYGLAYELVVLSPQTTVGSVRLSYGQQAMCTTFFAAQLGALTGVTAFLCWKGRWLLGVALSIAGTLSMLLLMISLWRNSVANYGPDPSDHIVYEPLVVGCVVVLAISGVVGVLALIGRSCRSLLTVVRQLTADVA